MPEYSLSNRFIYDEWINAAYLNYGRTIGKIDIQLGLRAEYTNLTGNQLGNIVVSDTSFTRNYGSIFPTLYIHTNLDSLGKHNLNFTYGRRIERPYFEDLNPFISPLDKFTFYTGNPDLLPTYSHNISLSHTYNNVLTTAISYSITTDGISETLEIDNGIYYSRPGNIAASQNLALSVSGNFQIAKWYSLNVYAEGALVRFDSDLYTEKLNSRGTNVYLSATNSFTIGKEWKMDIGGRFLNNHVSSQLTIKGYAIANIGIKRNIFKGKGSIRIAANDIFYSQIGSGIINNLKQTNADWNSKFDSRNVTITLSIKFGKTGSLKKKHNGSGSESEQQRIRG